MGIPIEAFDRRRCDNCLAEKRCSAAVLGNIVVNAAAFDMDVDFSEALERLRETAVDIDPTEFEDVLEIFILRVREAREQYHSFSDGFDKLMHGAVNSKHLANPAGMSNTPRQINIEALLENFGDEHSVAQSLFDPQMIANSAEEVSEWIDLRVCNQDQTIY
jgi:hypothetical protein